MKTTVDGRYLDNVGSEDVRLIVYYKSIGRRSVGEDSCRDSCSEGDTDYQPTQWNEDDNDDKWK